MVDVAFGVFGGAVNAGDLEGVEPGREFGFVRFELAQGLVELAFPGEG